jgi:uncharacterized membrane protein YfcA
VRFASMAEIGIVVGLLIGLTGIGSGSLLTPMLILIGGMSPATAVGNSLAFSFVTKLYGSWHFYRRGLVQMDIVRDLSLGAIPGALIGAFVIRYLGLRRPEIMNSFLLQAIGIVLILVSLIMLARLLPLARGSATLHWQPVLPPRLRSLIIAMVGFGVGVSVSLTSIGSGAALIPAMVLFYRLDSGTLVGTNVLMGMILAAVAGLPHVGLGDVDWKAVGALLCGGVPALWLSSQLHGRVVRQIPEGIIAAALMAMGIRIAFF